MAYCTRWAKKVPYSAALLRVSASPVGGSGRFRSRPAGAVGLGEAFGEELAAGSSLPHAAGTRSATASTTPADARMPGPYPAGAK